MSPRPVSQGYVKDPVACIYPRILIGAGCHLTREFAREHKVSHVINCATPADSPAWFSAEHPERYRVIHAMDSPDVDILIWYPLFEAVLLKFLRDPACTNVFVHCQCGINRSAFLTLAFLIDHFDLPLEDTARALIAQRPCALTNRTFWEQMQRFAKNRAKKHGGVPQ